MKPETEGLPLWETGTKAKPSTEERGNCMSPLTVEEQREIAAAQLEALRNIPNQLAKINEGLGMVNANLERLAVWFEGWAPRRGEVLKVEVDGLGGNENEPA